MCTIVGRYSELEIRNGVLYSTIITKDDDILLELNIDDNYDQILKLDRFDSIRLASQLEYLISNAYIDKYFYKCDKIYDFNNLDDSIQFDDTHARNFKLYAYPHIKNNLNVPQYQYLITVANAQPFVDAGNIVKLDIDMNYSRLDMICTFTDIKILANALSYFSFSYLLYKTLREFKHE